MLHSVLLIRLPMDGCSTAMPVQELFITHLHLHSGVHSSEALEHLHLVHTPLQLHRMSSLHAFDTSGILIHFGTLAPSRCFRKILLGRWESLL